MPTRNQKKQKRGKSQVLARVEKKLDNVLVYRGIGFPDEYYTDLVYTYTTSANVATYVPTTIQSSLYDPLSALGGTQPTFFDQLSAVYGQYQVMGMNCEIDVSSDGIPITVAWAWTREFPSFTSCDALAMSRYSGSRFVAGSGGPTLHIRTSMDMKKLFGYADITEVEALSALISANPAQMAYFTFAAQAIDGATATEFFVRIRTRFRCRFFGLLTPAVS